MSIEDEVKLCKLIMVDRNYFTSLKAITSCFDSLNPQHIRATHLLIKVLRRSEDVWDFNTKIKSILQDYNVFCGEVLALMGKTMKQSQSMREKLMDIFTRSQNIIQRGSVDVLGDKPAGFGAGSGKSWLDFISDSEEEDSGSESKEEESASKEEEDFASESKGEESDSKEEEDSVSESEEEESDSKEEEDSASESEEEESDSEEEEESDSKEEEDSGSESEEEESDSEEEEDSASESEEEDSDSKEEEDSGSESEEEDSDWEGEEDSGSDWKEVEPSLSDSDTHYDEKSRGGGVSAHLGRLKRASVLYRGYRASKSTIYTNFWQVYHALKNKILE